MITCAELISTKCVTMHCKGKGVRIYIYTFEHLFFFLQNPLGHYRNKSIYDLTHNILGQILIKFIQMNYNASL